jgi:Ca2+-transporting ATPase
MLNTPHLHTVDEVATHLRVDPNSGLAVDEVRERQAQHGPNQLPDAQQQTWFSRLLSPFRDYMIIILLAAAVLSGVIGDVADTLAILVIILLNAAIAIVQEWRADQALTALRALAAPRALVRRNAKPQSITTEQLVPGDIVILEAGNQVPADLRLHQVAQLQIDESSLTGESVTVAKDMLQLPAGDHALGDRINMAFKGTLVTHGRATGIVVATGAATELGRIATLLRDEAARQTPLQLRLNVLGKRLSLVVLAICSLTFAIGMLRGEPLLLMALTSISLAVAALPEALPAVISVLLALGARRLVQVHALVRRLSAVETLGSVTVICSDKTGTLTQNRMRVDRDRVFDTDARELWSACILCNDAHRNGDQWIGDPTETALAERAAIALIDADAVVLANPRQHEWPFDSSRKRMTTLHFRNGSWSAYTKGAPETVLAVCTNTAAVELARQLAEEWAQQGLRVLAVARRLGGEELVGVDADAMESNLTLIGLVGLIDPPREEALAAVTECRTAGIRPLMITGDHPATALAIARKLCIAQAHSAALTGSEIARLQDQELHDAVSHISVYARVDPAQKIRIVKALQARGEFVAMTGDGVNDAPALKAADIGVAMGRNGTDVAREAAGLVLLDDNFATIVAAVREGRRIFDNIRKFVRYVLSGNSGEIWLLLLGPLFGLPIPLLPIHILWVNLVTDGLPGLALAAEPAEQNVMRRPPRPPSESIFAHGLWQHTLWVGLLIGGLCLGVQAWAIHIGDSHWQTMVFTVLTFTQMAHVLAIRSESAALWRQGLFSNTPLLAAVALSLLLQMATIYLPSLQAFFHTQALSSRELAICVGCAVVVYLAVECEKFWRNRLSAQTRQLETPAESLY